MQQIAQPLPQAQQQIQQPVPIVPPVVVSVQPVLPTQQQPAQGQPALAVATLAQQIPQVQQKMVSGAVQSASQVQPLPASQPSEYDEAKKCGKCVVRRTMEGAVAGAVVGEFFSGPPGALLGGILGASTGAAIGAAEYGYSALPRGKEIYAKAEPWVKDMLRGAAEGAVKSLVSAVIPAEQPKEGIKSSTGIDVVSGKNGNAAPICSSSFFPSPAAAASATATTSVNSVPAPPTLAAPSMSAAPLR